MKPANPPPAQLLPAVQADRDRAADYFEATARTTSSPNDRTMMHLAELIRLGTAHHPLIETLAAHRLAHSPERGELASLVEAELENALCAPNWSQSLGCVHNALAALHALSASPEGSAK